MATVQDQINLALAQAYSSESQLTTPAITYANIVYHDIENALIEGIGDDFFYEYITTDTVANQGEYILPTSSSTVKGFKKVLSVEVKRSDIDTDYTLLNNSKNTEHNQSLSWLETYQPQSQGMYDIKDSSLFIYPAPLNSVTDGIKVQVLQNLIDLTAGDAETLVFPGHTELRQWHYLIALGMKGYIFAEKGLFSEKQQSDAEYRNELNKMIKSVSNRYRGASVGQLPDLSFYTR